MLKKTFGFQWIWQEQVAFSPRPYGLAWVKAAMKYETSRTLQTRRQPTPESGQIAGLGRGLI
jgi:hypothetical protein